MFRQHEQAAAERGRGRQVGEHAPLALALAAHRQPGQHLKAAGLGEHLLSVEHQLPLRGDAQAAAEQVAHRVSGARQTVRHHPLGQSPVVRPLGDKGFGVRCPLPLIRVGTAVRCVDLRFAANRLRRDGRRARRGQPERGRGQGQGEGAEIAALGLHGQAQHQHLARGQGRGRRRLSGRHRLLPGGKKAHLAGKLLPEHRAERAADNARHLGEGVGHLLGPGLRLHGLPQFHLGQHDQQPADAEGIAQAQQQQPHALDLAIQADRGEHAAAAHLLVAQSSAVDEPEHGRPQAEGFADERGHLLLDAVATERKGLFEAFSVVHDTAPAAGRRETARAGAARAHCPSIGAAGEKL